MPPALRSAMSMPPAPLDPGRWVADYENYKDGSDNHFNPVMVRHDPATGAVVDKRPLVREDLAQIDDMEPGRGGTYMYKKGDQAHNWQRRYFVVRQQLLIYFEEPTSPTPKGVIPLDSCQIRLPPSGAQHFDSHNDPSVASCYELWITHAHNRTWSLCCLSEMDRANWCKSLAIRTDKQRMLTAFVGASNPNPPAPPGLQSSLSMPLEAGRGEPVVRKKEKKKEPRQEEEVVKEVLNKSRRGSVEIQEMAMENTSGLRKRLQSTLTPEQEKAINDDQAAKARARTMSSDQRVMTAEGKRDFLDEQALKRWKEARAAKVKKLVESEADHPMTLSLLLRGQLIALDRVMAEPPHPGAAVKVPHLKGDWAGEVVIAVYNQYSTDGKMSFQQWLDFMDDVDMPNTHLNHTDPEQNKFDPAGVYRSVLSECPGGLPDDDCDKRDCSFPEFYTLLLMLCQRTYGEIYKKSSTDAMELFLHEVIVPIYYFHMSEYDHERCAATDPLVKDGRIALLLNAYLPNLWRVFLHYAQDLANRVPATFEETSNVTEFGTHKPLPGELAFPSMAQASERALFAGVHHLPSLSPEAEQKMGAASQGQVYTVHENGLLRFCEDFGLNELLPKKKIINVYKYVVNGRQGLKKFSPPKTAVKPHPMSANKMAPLGGRARSPLKSPSKMSLTGSPAFKPVGNMSAKNRMREMEFRERAGSVIRTSNLESFNTVEEILKARANAGPAVSTRISTSMYTKTGSGHAPRPGESIQVPSGHAGFCEFIEIVCTIATESMCLEEHHHKMYPSAYDKCLALLCIWGVADVKRVEQAKFMWPWDKKVPQNKKKATANWSAQTTA
ncbi:hypothetical protein TeGR_g2199 [Tetraparma gracilis]|uniref:PH domain-containing protein n=1 Tax=Tetraparma gracilis TaxID=2962635 RepID=A0ABQ6N996_9STRA|nr:hypothetical protein TeGR_g2199 [Tetraparma gracilis]